MSQSPPVPHTPFLHPTTQHLLLNVAAIGAAVVLPTLFPNPWIAGVAGAIGGLGQNLFSGFIQRFFDRRENDPTLPDSNSDLLRVVADAVARELATVAREDETLDTRERDHLHTFAGKAAPAFVELIHRQEFPDIAPPDVKQLFRAAAGNESPPVGTIEEWQQVVTRLASHCDAGLTVETEQVLAQRLHLHLWESIRTELKRDFAGDGRGYAALHLSFMGDVLAKLDTLLELPETQSQLTHELLDELRAQKTRVADPKVQAIIEKLTPADRIRVSTLTQRFEQLSHTFDKQYRRLSDQLVAMDRSAQRRHLVTQQRLWWLLAIVLVVAGGVVLLLRDTRQVIEKLDGGVFDKLVAQVSEKDQELGKLRAQLDAAERRAVEAKAKGNLAAGEALAQLRKDGDPKPLGAFLDQQLAEKQTDIISLLRERLAVAYVSGEIDRAAECAQQILATLPNDLGATNWLGIIYKLRGDLTTAEKQYRRLLELAPDDEGWRAVALGNLGLIAQTQGKLAEAEQFHRDALAIDQKLGRLEGQANQLGNLGVIYRTQGKLAEAEQFHRDALAINQKLGSLEGQANQLGNLGLIYHTQGKLAEAEQFYRDALAINQKLGSLEGQAIQLGNLGLIYRTQGKLAEAEQFHRDALAINQKLGSLEGQAAAVGNLGLIYRTQGKLAEAEQFHRDALALHQKLGSLEGQAIQLGNLGAIAEDRGNIADARRLWTEARDLFARVGAEPQRKLVESWLAGLAE